MWFLTARLIIFKRKIMLQTQWEERDESTDGQSFLSPITSSAPLWSLAPCSSGRIPCLFLNHTLLCIPILKSQFSINGASLVAQLVKNPPAMWKTWVQSLGWEDPLEKGKATHSSILVWRIPWTIQSMGSQRVRCNWATFTFTFSIIAWQLTLHEIVSSYLVIWWRGIRFLPLYIPREYV